MRDITEIVGDLQKSIAELQAELRAANMQNAMLRQLLRETANDLSFGDASGVFDAIDAIDAVGRDLAKVADDLDDDEGTEPSDQDVEDRAESADVARERENQELVDAGRGHLVRR